MSTFIVLCRSCLHRSITMDLYSSLGIISAATIPVAVLLAKTNITTSDAIFLALIISIVGSVGAKVSKFLISPYISPLRHIPGPSVGSRSAPQERDYTYNANMPRAINHSSVKHSTYSRRLGLMTYTLNGCAPGPPHISSVILVSETVKYCL
jgi:hypothetical protein